jgi:23S rRNA pseudouridine2604 synthase
VPGPSSANPPAGSADPPEGVRLSKRLSELGWCSRREADEFIAAGLVRVDGEVVSQLGTRVRPDQHVSLDKRAQDVQQAKPTVVLHKPLGIVSGQPEDGYHAAIELITADRRWRDDPNRSSFRNRDRAGLAVAGRLDIDSTGLLLLTADGRIARSVIDGQARSSGERVSPKGRAHVEGGVEKEYIVRVEGAVSRRGLDLLRSGLSLDGVALRPAHITLLDEQRLRFILREGRKRQIRRMCELVGLRVVALKRVRIGEIRLGNLPSGEWRLLGPDERP